ncbi:hypothetical protein KBB68_00035 [Candidatus Babeliales bacterium]|nr:hypothetical protein [Candidatus Babeliales bacterium]
MIMDIQSTLNLYTSMTYGAFVMWAVIAGFFGYICVLMIFTKLSFQKLYQPLLRMYAIGLTVAYLFAPIYLFLALKVMGIFSDVAISFKDILFVLFVIFTTTMQVTMRALLRSMFVQLHDKKFSVALWIVTVLLVTTGIYIVMNAGLIQ